LEKTPPPVEEPSQAAAAENWDEIPKIEEQEV